MAYLIRVAGGVLGGGVVGVIAGLTGSALGRGANPGWGDLIGAIVAGGAGYLAGVPLGVVIAGRLRKQRGSAWLALIASLLAGALVVALAEPLRLNTVPSLLQAVFVGTPAVASAWAFAARAGQYRAT